MSKKDLDLIIRSAFNDKEVGDDQLLAEWIAQDQSTQDELNKMSALQAGLKSLADVPECQLSSERLRQTILDQGVKPRRAPAFSWWKYALPAAALAAVAWMTVPNLKTISNAPVASNSGTVQPTQVDPAQLDEDVVATASSAATQGAISGLLDKAVKPEDIAQYSPALDRATTPSRPSIARKAQRRTAKSTSINGPTNNEVNKVASNVASLVTDHVNSIIAPDAPPTANRSAMAADSTASEMDARAKPEGNIVLVESKSNTSNGVPRAIEKQNNDIVFGG